MLIARVKAMFFGGIFKFYLNKNYYKVEIQIKHVVCFLRISSNVPCT